MKVTHRRESRENRRMSRTNPSIDYIFYSSYVSPSLDALMSCELPSVQKFPLPCSERDARHQPVPVRFHRGCLHLSFPFDSKSSRVAT